MNKTNRVLIAITILVLFSTTLALAQVNTERFRKESQEDNFQVKCGLSTSLNKGNMDIFRLNTDLNVNYYKGKSYLFLVGNLSYGEKNKKSYINKGFAHLRGIRKVTERFMVEVFAQQEFNEFILLNSRRLIGVGLRYLIFKNEKENSGLSINIGAGGMWEEEKFKRSDDDIKKEDTSFFKMTNYLAIHYMLSPNTILDEVTYIQFNLGNEKSTRITTEATLEVKLSKILSFNTQFRYRYDNNPPLTIKNYDVQLTNGLTLSL